MSNKFVIFSTKNGLLGTLPVPPDGIEGEVDGDLTVMRALQHVAGLQAVQEPFHQGYAPTTTATYNRTTGFSTKFQCSQSVISTFFYELGFKFFF
jgi:hypothetical protein